MRKHYSKIAAQHKSEDGLDPVKEGALLKRAQREEIEFRLAQLRRELWPTNAISAVLHQHNTNAKNRWLSLPTTYKSICPHISPRDIDLLDTLVRENLTEQAHDQLPADIRLMVQRFFEELHAGAEADGQPMGGSVSQAEPGKQRGSGPVENGEDTILAKDNGRGQ
jgi:phage terminase Nu1 subunit (DNA packaging protein)